MKKEEFIKQWRKAQLCGKKGQLDKSVSTFEMLVPFIETVCHREDYGSDEDYTEQMHFEKAMFWGDFTASLCDSGKFTEALETSKKALNHKEEGGGCSTLLYLYYNRGNIHLFMQEYTTALEWYDKALYKNEIDNMWLNENERADYYTNKAGALFFLERYEESEECFLKAISMVNNKDFEPFYFLSKLYERKEDNKKSTKYHKMFLTRKNKLTIEQFEQRTKFHPIKFE